MGRLKMLLVAALLFCVSGCVTNTDPATGEKTRSLDPNSPIVKTSESGTELVAALLPIAGPIGALISAALLGALAIWRKMKPELAKARTTATNSLAAVSATVSAIEDFKKSNPNEWAKLGGFITTELTKQGIDPKIVENVIRSIRGLPQKA